VLLSQFETVVTSSNTGPVRSARSGCRSPVASAARTAKVRMAAIILGSMPWLEGVGE
jgi:hypothetical protein